MAECLVKAAERFALVVEDIKNCQKLGNCQQVLDLLSEFEQLERSAFLVDGRKTRDELANPARIYVPDSGEVHKDLVLAFAKQASDGAAQSHAALADRNLAVQIKNGYVSSLTFRNSDIGH